jgi:hypothetical protein
MRQATVRIRIRLSLQDIDRVLDGHHLNNRECSLRADVQFLVATVLSRMVVFLEREPERGVKSYLQSGMVTQASNLSPSHLPVDWLSSRLLPE